MAVASKGRPELQIPRNWKERETSPERTKVWIEPKVKSERRVPVLYYLSRNGQLEHPHFMEVSLSSSEGLYLGDVINRLTSLRGKGMAFMYSWSSKRSYKNGFVWHDLAENDFIYPAHGQEYILKGTELLHDGPSNPKSQEILHSISGLQKSSENHRSGDDSDSPLALTRRPNKSWSSIDLHEYKVYKTDSTGQSAGKSAADASTQTEDKRRRRKPVVPEEQEEEKSPESEQNQSTELSREEVSPPPSDSSPETLENLMKADGRLRLCSPEEGNDGEVAYCSSGRMKASTVLMQLFSCGYLSFKDCGVTATACKDEGFSLASHYKVRLPRAVENHNHGGNEVDVLTENHGFRGVVLEDKEYFSGSLIETKKVDLPTLKRSSSYNDDRSSHSELAEKEIGGARAKCIPGKLKAMPAKKEDNNNKGVSCIGMGIRGSNRRQP